jgi:tetratricopeptide (TPR) repeat protein
MRRPRERAGQGAADLIHELLAGLVSGVYWRLLRLPLPTVQPIQEERLQAGELWSRLKNLTESQAFAVIRIAREFQSWALVERLCEESVVQASRDVERAAFLARLARAIAGWVPGPEGWRQCVQAFAAAHAANVLRVSGKLKAAATLFEEAWRLWHAGADPDALLDPGRLLDLEASLCRDQRRFTDALVLLDRAIATGRCPGRCLINKGFTLEAMGEYESALKTLLLAKAQPDVQADPRLHNILHCNMALDFCHVGRFAEAAELALEVRQVAAEMGDEIGLLRVTWINALIAAGLGRTAEALAALRLFHEAAEREVATAELARRVLRYLFRARHDEGFRFEA